MKIISYGFIWLDVTDKAKKVYSSGLFELYALYEDDSESLIQSRKQLKKALDDGLRVGIEVGRESYEYLESLYKYMGIYKESLTEQYNSIPDAENLFSYEQFVVAKYSTYINERI